LSHGTPARPKPRRKPARPDGAARCTHVAPATRNPSFTADAMRVTGPRWRTRLCRHHRHAARAAKAAAATQRPVSPETGTGTPC
jgi:hypothetical protein